MVKQKAHTGSEKNRQNLKEATVERYKTFAIHRH